MSEPRAVAKGDFLRLFVKSEEALRAFARPLYFTTIRTMRSFRPARSSVCPSRRIDAGRQEPGAVNRKRAGWLMGVLALGLACFVPTAGAATYYWDNNGTTNGFGTAAGTWAAPTTGNAAQGWSTSTTGVTLPGNVTTTTSDDLNFGSTTNGLAAGTVTVSGTVQANSVTFASGSGDITLSGGTIVLGGANAFIQANNAGQTIGSAITLNTNVSVIAGINGNPVLTLNGALSGTGNVTFTTPTSVNGSSGQATVLNLGAACSYAGTTLITAANVNNHLTIEAQVTNALPRTTVLTLDGGDGAGSGRTVAFELNGKSQTLAGLVNVNGLTLRNQRILNSTGTATLTISNTADFTFSGNINGSGLSLTKTGPGTQTLAKACNYTGPTTINAGTFQGVVGGNCSNSAVLLNSAAATLGVAINDNTKTWICAALTNNAAGTLEFDFAISPSVSTSPLTITGPANFTAARPAVSVLVNSALAAGTYPLVTWGAVSGTPPTNVTVSPLGIGTAANLNVSGNTLYLVISNLPPAIATVRVETKADGSGVLVPAMTLAEGTSLTSFAIARDGGGAFIGNVAANWSLTNVTGGVLGSDLAPSADGKSAIFTGNAGGSARILAFANATNQIPSGVITVTNTYTTRPFLWVRSWERNGILAKIATNAWATSLSNALVARAAADLASYQANRDTWLRGLPVNWSASPPAFTTGASSYGTGENFFNTALDCAVLYYLTRNPAYARCAADILHNSIQSFQNLAPSTSVGDGGWLIPSDLLYEARQVGTQLPVVYDFLYQYLQTNQVYDVATAGLTNFSFTNAQYVFRTYYQLVRDHGQKDDNWSALMSTCMLNSLLALDSATERAADLLVYMTNSSSRQASLDYDYRNYSKPGDIWPESLNYSPYVGEIRSTHMVLLERYDPTLNLFGVYSNLPTSLPRISYLRYPNNSMQITFGDGHRDAYGHPYFRYELMYQHALARGRTNLTALFGSLINGGVSTGNYNRSTLNDYDNLGQHDELLALLWNAPKIPEAPVIPEMPRSDALPWAGVTLQRNPSPVNNSTYGLMCFVGGAAHVHSHASGMSMELYGLGQVLGAKAGRDTYGSTLHENYYRLFSANNTIVVNAASQGSGGWESVAINTVQNIAMEPQPLAPAVSSNFSFTCSSFADTMGTLAEGTQQRTMAIIRTSPTNGFYVDFFRSKSTVTNRVAATLNGNVTNQFHDYIYHNVGSTNVLLTTNGAALGLVSQPNRFQNDIGDLYQQPGWRYFSNTVVSYPHSQPTRARFSATPSGTTLYLDLVLPAVTNREYALVTSPPIVDYSSSDSPALVVRQMGDAWNKPFAAVYEPHFGAAGATVTNVTALWRSNLVVGLKIESLVSGQPRVHYVFSHATANEIYQDTSLGLTFQGRFGVVSDNGDGTTTLYLGSGSALSYRGNSVAVAGGTNAAAEVQFVPGQPPVISANTTVTVVAATPPGFTRTTPQAGGILSLQATGSLGTPYTLWTTTNLSSAAWSTLGSSSITNSPFVLQDTNLANQRKRFYRLSTP